MKVPKKKHIKKFYKNAKRFVDGIPKKTQKKFKKEGVDNFSFWFCGTNIKLGDRKKKKIGVQAQISDNEYEVYNYYSCKSPIYGGIDMIVYDIKNEYLEIFFDADGNNLCEYYDSYKEEYDIWIKKFKKKLKRYYPEAKIETYTCKIPFSCFEVK